MLCSDYNSALRWFILLCLIIISSHVNAQVDYTDRGAYFDSTSKVIWPSIKEKLAVQEDTAVQFIVTIIQDFCDGDLDCAFHCLDLTMFYLGRESRFTQAIYIAEKKVQIAQFKDDLKSEADGYINISAYHDVMGNARLSITSLDKGIAIFKQLGRFKELADATMFKLTQSMDYDPPEKFLPKMDSLFAEVEVRQDSGLMFTIGSRLIYINIDNNRFEEVEKYVELVEAHHEKYWRAAAISGELIYAKYGRARLAEWKEEYDEARAYFQEALALSRKAGGAWMEIYLLEKMAKMEWKIGRRSIASAYLDTALMVTQDNNVEEQFPIVYGTMTTFAEEEGNYKAAFENIKQQYETEKNYKDRSKEFDLENYYLKLEKSQLESEQQRQALALQVQKIQNRNLWIILLLTALVVGGLVLGYYNQQESKRALAKQNSVIQQQANQLEEQANQLKALDEAKSRFFANVSHELRTPLSLLLGPIHSLMKNNTNSPEQLQLLQLASRSGANLQQLVTEILDLTKLEMGQMDLHLESVRLKTFFAQQLAQFDSLAQLQKITYDYQIALNEEDIASIDKSKYRQILNNLLSNAFKFTQSDEQIKILIQYEESQLIIRVQDTGKGIPEEDLPQLFDRYFQTNKPGRATEGGTGIGLAICKEYATLMGGTISVESKDGAGSTFTVALPIEITVGALEEEEREVLDPYTSLLSVVQATSPSKRRRAQNLLKTILVVEDNPELRTYIELILKKQYQILKAENGKVALELLENRGEIDLILSDLMMPVMDGFQLLEKIKRNDKTRFLPFIMLTARADMQDKLRALRIGVDDYLLKPFIEDELLARIENLIANQESRFEAIEKDTKEGKKRPDFSEEDRNWLEQIELFVKNNLENDILSVPMLAENFNMSESTLLRQLKRLTGLSPLKYIQEIRLDRAREMLENQTYNNVAKIAYIVGYKEVRSFSRMFKKRFGKLPSDFFNN